MITFREDFGCWWPDADRQPEACHAKVLRRLPDADLWMRFAKERRSVVQAGGHCGFWPLRIAGHAQHVFTFEPDHACYLALMKNVEGRSNIHHSNTGLGRDFVEARFAANASSSSRVHIDGKGTVQLVTIDSLGLTDCDAIILDVEGYELEVLAGAVETIARCRPVLHLENGDTVAQDAWMVANDYQFVMKMHSDRLFRSKT